MKLSDFRSAKVGDRVWDIHQGWGTVADMDRGVSSYPLLVNFKSIQLWYSLDGRLKLVHQFSNLYWDEVNFDVPPPPKRKVKKTFWFNFYRDGPSSITNREYYASGHSTELGAVEKCAEHDGFICRRAVELDVEE